jgi:hypothetical protein
MKRHEELSGQQQQHVLEARRWDLSAEMPINAVVVAVDLSALSARSAVSAFAVGPIDHAIGRRGPGGLIPPPRCQSGAVAVASFMTVFTSFMSFMRCC